RPRRGCHAPPGARRLLRKRSRPQAAGRAWRRHPRGGPAVNPTLLELNGFTSHRATSVHLNGEHLVAAVGPNGAGKSSLLSDAIEFALFGVARADRAEDLVQLGSSEMSVVL